MAKLTVLDDRAIALYRRAEELDAAISRFSHDAMRQGRTDIGKAARLLRATSSKLSAEMISIVPEELRRYL